jgi:hypothetical protein
MVNIRKMSRQTTHITAASPGWDAAKKIENMNSNIGRHSKMWFGKRPSFEYQVENSGTRRNRL